MRFLSQVYTIARGSVGGITYTANQWHQLIARARTSPVQPGTPHQAGIRSAFDVADADWLQLTPEKRELWNDYADTCVYTGPLGNYTVPGRQLFIGTIALAKYTNGISPGLVAMSSEPPAIAGFYNPGQVLVAPYPGATFGIAVGVGVPGPEDVAIVIDRSIAFPATRLRYKGPWISTAKTIQATGGPATHVVTIDTPAQTDGLIIFTRTRIFTAATLPADSIPHRISATFYLRHEVEPAPPPAAAKGRKTRAPEPGS